MTTLLLAALVAVPRVGVDGDAITVDGRPTILIGDSVTQGWAELGLDFDPVAYLDCLAGHGLSAVMLWTYIGVVDPVADARIGYACQPIFPWTRHGRRFDGAALDETYFGRLREFVVAAGELGLVVILTIHDGWTKTRFAGHPLNATHGGPLEDRRQYVELANPAGELPVELDESWDRRHRQQWVVERFEEALCRAVGECPNLVFELFNEGEWYDQGELAAFQCHSAAFLRARCDRPLLINLDHATDSLRAVADIVSLHKPNWDEQTTAAAAFEHFVAAHGEPARPLVFSEPVPEYQGDASHHDALTRLMWGTALAGASFLLQDDVSFGFAARSAMAARRPVADALLARLGATARLLSSLDLRGAQPAGNLSLASNRLRLAYQPEGAPRPVAPLGWATRRIAAGAGGDAVWISRCR